jgi:hydrogenase expression/formation protein HypC
MCLAVPAKVVELRGDTATVDMEGIRREVSVVLVPEIKLGEYAIVHAGFAIGRLDEHEALDSLKLIRQALGSEEETLETQGQREKQEKQERQEKQNEQRQEP